MLQKYFQNKVNNLPLSIFNAFLPYVNYLKQPIRNKPKTHGFQNLKQDKDYFLDFTQAGKTATLTTHKWIKPGDIVKLSYQGEIVKYYAENIDTYCNSDTLQTVWLKKIK